METLTKPYRKLMEPSMENINNTLNLIKEFVKKNNYVVKGKLSNPLDKNDIFGFKIKNYGVSKKQKKHYQEAWNYSISNSPDEMLTGFYIYCIKKCAVNHLLI